MRQVGVLAIAILSLTAVSAARAASTTEPPSMWTHTYSAKCEAVTATYTAQTCSLGIEGDASESLNLQLGQELVDHTATSGAREQLTVTAPATCVTGSVTLTALKRLDQTVIGSDSQVFKFDLRKGNTVVTETPKLFTGPWQVLIQPTINGLVPASDCPGLSATTTFPLTLKLEAAPNSATASSPYQYPKKSGRLKVEFTASGGGTFTVRVRIRKLHSNGPWVTFGTVKKKSTAPKKFTLSIAPSDAAEKLIRKGGYIVQGRDYFDLYTTVSVVDLYGKKSSTYDHASYSF